MNDKLNSGQSDTAVCTECKSNPCVCPKSENDQNNNSGEKGASNKVKQRTEPPKISWI